MYTKLYNIQILCQQDKSENRSKCPVVDSMFPHFCSMYIHLKAMQSLLNIFHHFENEFKTFITQEESCILLA